MIAAAMGPRGLACAVLATIPLSRGIEGAAWLPQGHGGSIELTEAIVTSAGDRQDSACAAVDHHGGPFTHAESSGIADHIAQLSFNNRLQHGVKVGFDQEIPFSGNLRTHKCRQVPAHLIGVKGC